MSEALKPLAIARDIVVNAAGNLLAAFVVLILAAFVGVGTFTSPYYRFFVITFVGEFFEVGMMFLAAGILLYMGYALFTDPRTRIAGALWLCITVAIVIPVEFAFGVNLAQTEVEKFAYARTHYNPNDPAQRCFVCSPPTRQPYPTATPT